MRKWAASARSATAARTTISSSALIEKVGGAAHLPQVLYYWRVHAGSTSGGTDAKPYVAKAAKKALADHLTRTGRVGARHRWIVPQHLPRLVEN